MRKAKPKNLMTTIFALVLLFVGVGCQPQSASNGGAPPATSTAAALPSATPVATPEAPTLYTFEVVNSWPHDKKAFTQGLIFHDGSLLESTGQYGESTLRRVELKSGKVKKKIDVGKQFFAEGITLFNGKVYQLTWQNRKGFVYDAASLNREKEFYLDGDGWGLTHDGESLILSDGSDQLRFIDPETFKVKRTIKVADRGKPIRELNELEYVKGEIFANVWHDDRIARIDPRDGRVVGWIDLKGLLPANQITDGEAVLNGIAYDEAGDRLFVTGKLWPKLFEIRVVKKP